MDYPKLRKILSKYQKPARYVLLAAILQLSSLSYLNYLLAEENQPIVNESQLTKVVEREQQLADYLIAPSLMSLSPDKTLVALKDDNQLKIYRLADGQLQTQRVFPDESLTALQWLPDRNRLIFALVQQGAMLPAVPPLGPEDPREDPHSKESLNEFRPPNQLDTNGFQIALYSLDFTSDPPGEDHIQTLNQKGATPTQLNLIFSTYSNLLYVHWTQEQKQDSLAVVDIMKRIKDIRLPAGQLSKLAVMPKTGELWSESNTQNGYIISSQQKGRWKHHKELDGYRLLGVGANDQPILALDQQDWVSEIAVLTADGNLKPTWAFEEPVKLADLSVLSNGSLLRIDHAKQTTSVYPPGNKGATVYPTAMVGCLAADGKMLISWKQASGSLSIFEEVQE